MKYYIPMSITLWDDMRAGGFDVQTEGESIGFIPVYKDEEEAKKDFPGFHIMCFEGLPKPTVENQ